jgi:5S rRNA maturation endonuclease (ribonuclease M5)
MIQLTKLVCSLLEVPREWIFEYYLKLPENLSGQDVNIKSPFNENDNNPSFFVYVSKRTNKYHFKDFSTGIGGDHIELVRKLFNLELRGEAGYKIIIDYNDWKLQKGEYKPADFKKRNKYELSEFKVRKWNYYDKKYWSDYKLSSKRLEKFKIFPLEYYCLKKEEDGEVKEIKINGNNLYGYFNLKNEVYKIYNPLSKEHRFFKVKEHIQGLEQLTFEKDYLIITKSLKDVACIDSFNIVNLESISVESENVLIPRKVIDSLKIKYKKILVLMDNDKAGKIAVERYKETYGFDSINFTLDKDVSDSIKNNGITLTIEHLIEQIKITLENKKQNLLEL